METSRTLMAALAAAAFAIASTATGCSHSHEHDGHVNEGDVPRRKLLTEAESAADAVVSATRLYLDAREKSPTGPAPKDAIGARDAALEALLEAAQADRVCDVSIHLADDADIDPGRAARLKSSATLVRRATQVVAKQAGEVARTGGGEPMLRTDLVHLRAALRALKVDLFMIQAAAREDE